MIGWIELTEDHCSRCDGITMLPIITRRSSILFCANCGVIHERPVSGQYRIITGRDGLYEEGEI
jgi:hypothetical protein